MNRVWLYVFGAGALEVLWVIGLRHSSNVLEWTGTAISILFSFMILIKAARTLPVGTVYAVFAGLGTCGTVLVEMLVFGEPFKWNKILLIAVLLTGVIGLKLISKDNEQQVAKAGETQ
ncbi:DMT family transporter [Paenibacillus sp. GCM10012307]|uniref:Multidrug efflux SMR transporter n=1 Tax=Paenibacillus roseus TaxID=2798579 RepID=A0A934J4G5_9BACL|nr:multidrug efflux SMR transporter [Paenibacillus roseus]MBJ6362685.1 multidrug efflux SMR transporter [Paenibacillus roseus]